MFCELLLWLICNLSDLFRKSHQEVLFPQTENQSGASVQDGSYSPHTVNGLKLGCTIRGTTQFRRYCEQTVKALVDNVGHIMTFNKLNFIFKDQISTVACFQWPFWHNESVLKTEPCWSFWIFFCMTLQFLAAVCSARSSSNIQTVRPTTSLLKANTFNQSSEKYSIKTLHLQK